MRLLLAALLIALTAAPALADGHPGKTDVFASAGDFAHASPTGARWDERAGGFRLRDAASGGYVRTGTIVSEALRYGIGFNRAILSWNADCPAGTWVRIEAQVSADYGEHWSGWYEVAAWGDAEVIPPAPSPAPKDAWGRVNEDTLELSKTCNRLRWRVTLHTTRPAETPVLSLVAVAIADTARTLPPDNAASAAWGKELPAEYRSQLVENGDMSYRLCGPTAATMGLSTHGVSLATKEVARACWDSRHGLYGNWPFIAAGASVLLRAHAETRPARPGRRKASRAFVAWPADWKQIEQEISDGNPVILSLYFGPGELKGAMTEASDGHLILVRGFTKSGDVICSDPASWKASQGGRVVYDRHELHRARHGGPVIFIRPYE